jgi:hypothetical protein
MGDSNGTGRLDRIESVLDKITERLDRLSLIQDRDHEEFTRDHKQLMTWQVLMQEKMDRADAIQQAERLRLNTLSEKTDERIASLVAAIGQLITHR